MFNRRKFLGATAATLVTPAVLSRRALAEGWPTGEVKIVVGFEGGGATDTIARTLAEKLKDVWKHPVNVENKPGHGGNIAAEMVAKAAPDGNTIFIVGAGHALNQYMYAKLAYDPVHDFAPVTLLVSQADVMAVSANSQFDDVKEFIDYAKANPGKATYASSGTGTSLHLCGELFEHLAGVEMKHVPYKGSDTALRDVLLERVDVIFDNITSVLPHVMSGGARALAVTTAKRIPVAPDVPTLIESGLKGFDVEAWFALFVPAKTPHAIVQKIHDATKKTLDDPDVRKRLEETGSIVIGNTPAEFAAQIKTEYETYRKVVVERNLKPE